LAYGYSCVQCSLPQDIADEIYEWGLKNIPAEDLAADGRESDIHVTVKYGLHGHDPFELRDLLFGKDPIRIQLKNISLFSNDEHDVVKLGVESPELHQFNKLVSDSFEHTDTHPDYIPHVTIAYVKKGLGKKYDGRSDFSGRECLLDSVVFSGNDNRRTELPIG
jgi:2'-5' RNA ligase